MWGNLYFVGKYAIFVGKKKLIMRTSRRQAAGSDCGGGREGSGGHARGRAPYPFLAY